MSDDLELTGRRALLTGGTLGIGQAVVSRSREAGVRVLIKEGLRPTAAELIRVKRHKLLDAHRRPAGHPLHAVRQPVIPTRPVQLRHRQQMQSQVLRQPLLLEVPFPILRRNVSVCDLTVQRVRVLPGERSFGEGQARLRKVGSK